MSRLEDLFTDVHVVTTRNQKKTVTSSIDEYNAFYMKLKERGAIKAESGGSELFYPQALVENQSNGNFAGYDRLNVGESSSLRGARYGRVQKYIYVTANSRELMENSGKQAMVKLVKARQDIARSTAANRMAIELYGDGTASESLNGLAMYLPENGAGTVGGIDSSVYINWQSKASSMGTANTWSKTTIEDDLSKLRRKCLDGNSGPDLVMASNDIYNALEAAVRDRTRYNGYMDSKSAYSNFDTIMLKSNVMVAHDVNVNFSETAEKAYLLDTKEYELVEHPDAKWEFEEGRKPVDVAAVAIPAFWFGQFCLKKRRTSGVLYDLAA